MNIMSETKRNSFQLVHTLYTLLPMILIQLLLLLLQFKTTESANNIIALPNCTESCGGIPIPYPFGIGASCSFSKEFNVICQTSDGNPNPFLGTNSKVKILNISLSLGQARTSNIISPQCYNSLTMEGKSEINSTTALNPNKAVCIGNCAAAGGNYGDTPFQLNTEKNKFTVIGCNALAYLSLGATTKYSVGCLSMCDSLDTLNNSGSCSGIGCCQTAIPKGAHRFYGDFDPSYDNSEVYKFSPCSYVMVVEEAEFKFRTSYITTNELKNTTLPMVFDWSIGNTTCDIAQKNKSSYACISSNSMCWNGVSGRGYLCNCSDGYEGNPYLHGGCQDIDECAIQNLCSKPGKCHNLEGSYRCSCPLGWRSNHKNPRECDLNVPLVIGTTIMLGFVTAISIILVYFVIAKRIKLFEKRKQEKLKQKFFVQNRGLLLQQLIASNEETTQTMRNFRLDELEKATNRFDNGLIIGRGGHGEVYKGILSDQRVVAIKQSKIVDQTEIDQFINEVVILSQVNHRNVVKLYGCCLETEVPLLVYEFISRGTLFDHLHVEEHCSLTWKHRLRIAVEAAGAISYLHSSASISVFHRDIKSSNILLDDYFTAKVSDFGASRSVRIDQTGVTTVIQGTYGYLDPEYYRSGRLTQKSDVYSFGVILAELLTRQKPLISSGLFDGGSLVAYFSSAMKENRLFEILDPQVVNMVHRIELEAVAKLAEMCLRMKGEQRPTMKEVEIQLEVLWRSQSLVERQLILLDYNAQIDTTLQFSFEQELQSSSVFLSTDDFNRDEEAEESIAVGR
ncbi:wall-associated receptor kinase 2-like isoform X1 [Carex rostrata]